MNRDALTMNIGILVAKLVDIGKASRGDDRAIRCLVIEAQNTALDLQRQVVSLLRENERLRLG